MILGPLWGSDLKMWWIAGFLEYRSGWVYFGLGVLGSRSMVREKRCDERGVALPKEARRIVARRGEGELKSGRGRSFWAWF
jgi:hypothetical protein